VYTGRVQPGQQIGRYRVIGALGRGGMGGVYEVEDVAGARFALKSPIADVNGDATARFAREANALRLLDHPNLVAAVDVFVEGNALYLVMEKVVGRTLFAAIQGKLAPRQALVLVRQLLEGVGHAHAQGLVHRDLKPDNVLLVDMGGWERAKIIDFGLVKLVGDAAAAFGANVLTRTGLVFGTPAYMAPEQALGRPVDTRSDLYAIGVLLFEMLAGRRPFEDPDPQLVMRQHVRQPPPRLDELTRGAPWCTPALLALVGGALVKEPEHRYQSAAQMMMVLDDAFASLDHL
jgi:serine/threonine-protein kinase